MARREEILAVAEGLFREGGYVGLTTDAVAARCRMSKRTLYQLFPSKVALIRGIIDRHRQLMIRLPADYDGVPLVEALELIFRNDVDADTDRERFAFLQLLFVESALHPELDEIAESYGRKVVIGLLTDWIAHECAVGRLDVADPADAAQMLMDLVAGSITRHRDGHLDWPGSEKRRAYVSACIRLFVNGARA